MEAGIPIGDYCLPFPNGAYAIEKKNDAWQPKTEQQHKDLIKVLSKVFCHSIPLSVATQRCVKLVRVISCSNN